MNIRFCNREDEKQIRKIWEYCFEDGPEEVDFYYKYKFSPKHTVALEKDGKLISSIHLNQHRINLRGKVFDTTYVVGVSTLPEARSTGKMKELMRFSLRAMYDMNQSVSILMPIDFRLYTRFGFQNCYDMELQKVGIWDLKSFKITGEFREADRPLDLKKVYSDSVERYNGYALRDEKYFSEFIEEIKGEGGYIYINYLDGEPVGYIAYNMNGETFLVREIYYRNIEAYRSLLGFVFNHNTQCSKVEIYTDEASPLRELMENPKDAVFEKKPFMMGRIINFSKFVDDIEVLWNPEIEGLKIRIKDEYIDENNGVFEFIDNGGKVRAVRSEYDGEADEFTIGELTSIAFQYRKVSDIDFMYGKNLKDGGKLEKVFETGCVKCCNHINEYV